MPEQITESVQVSETESLGDGRYRVLAISAGTGSSGEYPPETLKEAATKRLVTKGTQSFWDHPSVSEDRDRPERSVRDLVGVFTSDAVWDDEHQGLIAEYQVFSPYRALFSEMAEYVGLSIRGGGEIEMRDGKRVITSLESITSVDVVTRAGRGGKVLSLLESARPEQVNARAVAHGVAEATANEVRERLQDALRDRFGGESTYVWVRDFDDTTVWFDLDSADESATWQLTYTTTDDGAVALAGDPVKVIPQTRYVPVAPAEAPPNTTRTEESNMPQIEEGRLAQLEEAAGRVQALESERDTARAEATAARTQLAEALARVAARPKVAAKVGESQLLAGRTKTQTRVVESVVAALPVIDGTIADEALTAAVEAAVTEAEAEFADVAPTAPLFGSFGSVAESASTSGGTQINLDEVVGSAFGRTGA